MKKILYALGLFIALLPLTVFADLQLVPGSVRFSTNSPLEGRSIRVYATVQNTGDKDLKGVVKFLDGKTQLQGDQPVSALAGKEDSVFVDFTPGPGEHAISLQLVPFEKSGDNAANNIVTKTVVVLADTDRDGAPNTTDPDDDGDKVEDDKDAFPTNSKETVDTDGDAKGNNEDDDDDNDGVKDAQDAFPLDTHETKDSDKDGVGDTKDAFPTDPSKALDFDKDGIGDKEDTDADNDGIVKTQDVNDTNNGPDVVVTSSGKKQPKRIVGPGRLIVFETSNSTDSDGLVAKTEWVVDGTAQEGDRLATSFNDSGFHEVIARVFDDKGEFREKSFSLLVISPLLLWLGIGLIFAITILALFLVFSYSKRR